jgi:hypothetical protein
MAWSNLHCIWLYAILAFLTFTSLLSDLFSSSSLYHFAFSTFNNDLIELHLLMHIRPSEYLNLRSIQVGTPRKYIAKRLPSAKHYKSICSVIKIILSIVTHQYRKGTANQLFY